MTRNVRLNEVATSPAGMTLRRLDARAGGRACLDHYARMAGSVADVPVAVVAFAGQHRVEIRGRAGAGTAVDIDYHDFCAGALHARCTVYLPDLTVDARFADHPMVKCAPHLRFYAAAPLFVDDRAAIGCLALLDYQPRTLTTSQLRAVRFLADDLQHDLVRCA